MVWQLGLKRIMGSGQRWQPIKPPERSLTDIARMAQECKAMKKAEDKAKAIEMLETMSQEAPLLVTSLGNFPEEFFREMFSKMACQWCNFIPTPYRRYICPDGHFFCTACGVERFVKHGGKCMIEARPASKELNYAKKEVQDGSSSAFPVQVKSGPYHCMDSSNHFLVCQRKIRLYAADPVFASIWVCAVWKCPGGCNEDFQGRDLLQHLMYCMQEKNSEFDEGLDELSEEESSVELAPLEEEPIVTLNNGVNCIVSGCSQQILVKDVVEHVILNHGIYAMDVGDDEEWTREKKAGLLYVPQSNIEARQPFYTLIRYCRRFFLFCMEPSTQNPNDVAFWIRRISNMENKEEEDGPYFKYDLFMIDKFRDMQVVYKNSCIPWRKPAREVLEEYQCMTLPVSFLIEHLVLIIDDDNSDIIDEDDEMGYLPVNFRILIEKAVEDLYFDEIVQAGTSSMESLAIVSTSAIVSGASECSEVATEVDRKYSDVESDDADADDESKEEDDTHQLDDNSISTIARSNQKIKYWFETNFFKDEVFSCQYSP